MVQLQYFFMASLGAMLGRSKACQNEGILVSLHGVIKRSLEGSRYFLKYKWLDTMKAARSVMNI